MEDKILGLHHITAIADNAQRNYDFYIKVLGLRMVKKTVNFDDPGTYHFYYGNEQGAPGTILTFFPWEGIGPGKAGTGMATEIGYAVPAGSFGFWKARFDAFKVPYEHETDIFGEPSLAFTDPDGLKLVLVITKTSDERKAWESQDINQVNGLKGFHYTALTLKDLKPTATILTDIFGYRQVAQEGNRYRFVTDAIATANSIDIILEPDGESGRGAAGTNHHIAFRVQNEEIQMRYREKIVAAGYQITAKIDRDYFYSLYFREPGGVLFEIATDNPGFTVDEPLAELGSHLKLPAQYEGLRDKIETALPKIQ